MSSPEPTERLSLIPYDSDHRQIVLKHNASVVVFDQHANELSLRSTRTPSYSLNDDCPYCHRPLQTRDEMPQYRRQTTTEKGNDGFINPDYFRMLAHSLPEGSSARPDSTVTSPLPGPLPALGSPATETVSDPPTGAEFVGSAPRPRPSSTSPGIRGSSFLPGYFGKFFVEKKLLGRGGRGVVHLVEHLLDGVSLGDFACKKIPVGNDHDWLAKVLIEVQLLQQLDHLNLVSYRHVWLEDAQINSFGPSVPCVFILQQYCNSGDLHTYVKNLLAESVPIREVKSSMRLPSKAATAIGSSARGYGTRRLALDEIFSFFKDITSGLHHLHTHGYIHRDLKPSNCLLHADGSRTIVLVSDFGEVQAAGAIRTSTGATGTISYCAPEVLKQDRENGAFGNFTTSSDIFSLGMIVFYMCFGRLPYTNADIDEEIEDVDLLRSEILDWTGFDDADRVRDDLPERLYKYLSRLLSLDPSDRPSTESILRGIKIGASGLDETDSPTASATTANPSPSRQASRKSQSRFGGLSQTWRESPSLSPAGATDGTDASPPRPRSGSDAGHEPGSGSGSGSPKYSSDVILSRRKLHDFTRNDGKSMEKRRLMLPPPPSVPHVRRDGQAMPTAPSNLTWFLPSALIFLIKLHIVLGSCPSGFPKPWVLHSLLTLAVADFSLPRSRSLSWSLTLQLALSFGVHLAAVRAFGYFGGMCSV